jgi:N-acetyl-anhydromuramyl-L-alanine amidase AmpD
MNLHHSIPLVPSPHFSSRKGYSPETVIIHYTGGGRASGTVSWFVNALSKVSAHFVISRTGRIVQTVGLDFAAWHAGISEMEIRGETLSGVNLFSIGVELANHGYLYRDSRGLFWHELGGEMHRYHRAEPIEAELTYDNGHSIIGWWEPYPEEQIAGLERLIKLLRDNGYKNAVHRLRGHEEVAMPFGTRKRDPGPLFPWTRFGRQDGRRTSSLRLEV